MIKDFFDVLSECISDLTGKQWIGIIWASLGLAALCWFVCVYYTKLWNNRFHVKPRHHFICGIAVILTVLFTLSFRAFGNLEEIVCRTVDEWEEQLVTDDEWGNETFEQAYLAVEKVNPDAFRGLARPGEENCFIPIYTDEMTKTCVTAYVDAACGSFRTNHRYLNMLVHAEVGLSEEAITQDIVTYFKETGKDRYPLERAVALAARYIREELVAQAPGTVAKTRWLLAFLFLLVQSVPFGWIGYCAYKDLRIRNEYN
ncbi:MAG: hypothetical protein LBK96_04850 [Prevotellaceae bacterium]|jgi:hypothetical protein|nr:hypothetical protein [Prevotellaceae bacterium]